MKIGNTHIGFKQIKNEPPRWYRRLANAIIMFFLPALVGSMGVLAKYHLIPDVWFNFTSEMSVYFGGIMKGVQFFLGKSEQALTITKDKKEDSE